MLRQPGASIVTSFYFILTFVYVLQSPKVSLNN